MSISMKQSRCYQTKIVLVHFVDICHRYFYIWLQNHKISKSLFYDVIIVCLLFFFHKVLACSAKNMFLLNFSLATNLPTIIIPALTGLNPSNNPNEHLKLSPEQQSWIGEFRQLYVIINT